MNLMIATVGVDPGWLSSRGGGSEALCVAVFAAVGIVLLVLAARLLKGRRTGLNSHRCDF